MNPPNDTKYYRSNEPRKLMLCNAFQPSPLLMFYSNLHPDVNTDEYIIIHLYHVPYIVMTTIVRYVWNKVEYIYVSRNVLERIEE